MKQEFVCLTLAIAVSAPALAAKPCEQLKEEITKKVEASGAKGYSLEIVAAAETGAKKVVGRCEAGSKKIVYEKK